ncbi:MAG: hypothetical protein U5L11_14130 [Arhodomonas sp.]|nr:hypothetical protein [Arhodomonas sp.]
MGQDHTPAGWQALLNGVLETFFRPWDKERAPRSRGCATVAGLVETAAVGGLAAELRRSPRARLLREALGEDRQQPVRRARDLLRDGAHAQHHFEAVCLIGLNDRGPSRQDPSMDFDLMARDPRAGDRSLREDDRYLFLEALLAARRSTSAMWAGTSVMAAGCPRCSSKSSTTPWTGVSPRKPARRPASGYSPSTPCSPSAPATVATPRRRCSAMPRIRCIPDARRKPKGSTPSGFADEPVPEPEPELRALHRRAGALLPQHREAFLRLRLDTRLQREVAGEAEASPSRWTA